MTVDSRITTVEPHPDGSIPFARQAQVPGPAPWHTEEDLQNQVQTLREQVHELHALLAKPLSEILGDRETALDTAAAWDAFGAMWMLSQRAMRRVALDLAAQQGVSEADVVARAMRYANDVLNGDGVDLHGSIVPAQMAHIERHTAQLRKQFRMADTEAPDA